MAKGQLLIGTGFRKNLDAEIEVSLCETPSLGRGRSSGGKESRPVCELEARLSCKIMFPQRTSRSKMFKPGLQVNIKVFFKIRG